jgi:hypothetical protein
MITDGVKYLDWVNGTKAELSPNLGSCQGQDRPTLEDGARFEAVSLLSLQAKKFEGLRKHRASFPTKSI